MLKKAFLVLGTCLWTQAIIAKDLTEVYQLALKNDPTFQRAIAASNAEKEALPQAIAQFLPTLSANATVSEIDSGLSSQNSLLVSGRYNTQDYNLNLSQPIFHFDYFTTLDQSIHTKRRAAATVVAASQSLITRVSEQYFAILAARDDLDFTKSQRIAFARQLEQAQQRFDVGLIAITDVHEARARHDNAVARELAAKNNVSNQYEILREITGVAIDDILGFEKDDKIPLLPPNPSDQEAWVRMAQQNNLEILINTENTKIADSNIGSKVAGHYPIIDLTARAGNSKSQQSLNRTLNTNSITLTATIPLFEGGAVLSRTREARSRYEESLKTLDITRRSVDSESRQKYRGVLTNIAQVDALTQAVVSNKSALKATQAAYDVGTRTIVDVLDAESQLLNAQRDFAQARYDYILEGLRLKLAAGTLKPEDLYSINMLLVEAAAHHKKPKK